MNSITSEQIQAAIKKQQAKRNREAILALAASTKKKETSK